MQYTKFTYLDLIFEGTSLALVTGLMSINFFENFVTRHHWIMIVTSVLSAYIVAFSGRLKFIHRLCPLFDFPFSDIACNIFHYYQTQWPLNTSYDVFVLCMIYMFLPIPSITGAALLAFSVSLLYVVYFVHFLVTDPSDLAKHIHGFDVISVDVFHFLGFNMMGIFFRIMNETVVRASFLDRHQFIKEEIWLSHALRQESILLDSILPPQIAKPIQNSIQEVRYVTDWEKNWVYTQKQIKLSYFNLAFSLS